MRWQPGDGPMDYNMRTAAVISKWCERAGVQLLYSRVVEAVYQAAWRDHVFTIDSAEAPLKVARDYRNEEWWQTYCQITSQNMRKKLGACHRQAGAQKRAWEHIFVAAWGIHWRSRREVAQTLSEWMKNFSGFITLVCKSWGLPLPWSSAVNGETPLCTVKLQTHPDDIPTQECNPRAQVWDSHTGRLWIQTDNKLLADAFNGKSCCDPLFLRPVCIRIRRSLCRLLEGGWRPRQNISPFIEWDGRKFNSLADHAANVTLDKGQNWFRIDRKVLAGAKDGSTNLCLSSDGALRGDGKASAWQLLPLAEMERLKFCTVEANSSGVFHQHLLQSSWQWSGVWRFSLN